MARSPDYKVFQETFNDKKRKKENHMLMQQEKKKLYPGPYRAAVDFEKRFTTGNLNGLTVKDRLHFVDKQDAQRWIDAVSKLNKDNKFFNFQVVCF